MTDTTPPTPAQIMADPRVKALVDAAHALKTEWAIHTLDGLTYLVVNAGNGEWSDLNAALAAFKEKTK